MLDFFFRPQSLAIVGASRNPEKLGHAVLSNIINSGFPGRVYPVNPKARALMGLPCYPSVLEIPDPVDLAIIVIPYPYVPAVVEQCGQKGVKGIIVISAGFRETGEEGRQHQADEEKYQVQ